MLDFGHSIVGGASPVDFLIRGSLVCLSASYE